VLLVHNIVAGVKLEDLLRARHQLQMELVRVAHLREKIIANEVLCHLVLLFVVSTESHQVPDFV
jgi:hypothetical protein